MISGTHTHSTSGGFLTYLLYDLTSMGFVSATKNALVRGITQSIINAHNNMKESKLFLNEIEIENANINRSPSSYKNNPEFERAQWVTNIFLKFLQINLKIFLLIYQIQRQYGQKIGPIENNGQNWKICTWSHQLVRSSSYVHE